MTYMINRWRVKIDWKKVYNVRDPLRMGDRGKKSGRREKGENCSSLHNLENLCNLVLKRRRRKIPSSSDETPEDKVPYFNPYPCYSTHTQSCLVIVVQTKT